MKNILIHGLDQDDKSWDKVKEYLREYNYNVICPNIFDLLKNDSYEYNNLYGTMEERINNCNDKVNLCGLSLGGILALDYAKNHPEEVNSLILIGVPYKIPKLLFSIQTFIFKLMPQSNFLRLGLKKDEFINLLRSMKDLNISDQLEQVTSRTLLLCGKEDKLNIKSSKLFNEKIKNSKFEIIKNSVHEINIDNP
ncbi:alpha/beta fold hydrolase [Anaerococcus vaginalis]|uniref:alpha/beta fold hydrolase n=2 Tax=Anaerococcus TaxID=165779 RepID=UPI002432B51D|nr:alpha/beta hydrolase [Anaerococcus vaginalis]MDY6128308.1 alpha/beta hydrolase [Anaerococcus sp.]